ncbi:hypothetical protein QN277_012067 [Acacia crassicarpa]|uniref:Alpha/beta hydrolase fold-3 domain-containing protein n=1 Tax=Acacia crassicarpa TaxID=499986 RepID=A0AAE1TCG7_9FABA|nr:hypothetical protein QN277_012067 [Acacia crassicarpa]
MDPYNFLHIAVNTITRLRKDPETPADPNPHLPVLSKDLTINPSRNTWARIYLPHEALNHSSSSSFTKLPIIAFYHGGGFIGHAANTTFFHDFLIQLVQKTQCVLVSVNYRLAPEHRLPAAYDDALEALHWIRTSEDKWLTSFADYSKCYLMGESAGGNIAYNAGLRATMEVDHLEPVKIKGLILVQPFFGGVKRTSSEERLANDTILPLPVTDLKWVLSLPVGADRDHEYSNPTAEKGSKVFDNIARLGWKVIVFGTYGDPLIDRQIDLVKSLQKHHVHVEDHFQGEDKHGAFGAQPTKGKALELYDAMKKLFTTN